MSTTVSTLEDTINRQTHSTLGWMMSRQTFWVFVAAVVAFVYVSYASPSFLTPGKRYRAQIYRDGPKADYRGRGKEIVIEERRVTSADILTLRLAPGGGQAIRFVAGGRR